MLRLTAHRQRRQLGFGGYRSAYVGGGLSGFPFLWEDFEEHHHHTHVHDMHYHYRKVRVPNYRVFLSDFFSKTTVSSLYSSWQVCKGSLFLIRSAACLLLTWRQMYNEFVEMEERTDPIQLYSETDEKGWNNGIKTW